MGTLAQNLKFAIRQLSRNPGFTMTVVLTLALSIGANTAIFSIVNALMLKSLPYSHPERMGTIYTRITGSAVSDDRHKLNGEQWELLRDNVPSLISAVSAPRTSGVNLGWGFQGQYLNSCFHPTPVFDGQSRLIPKGGRLTLCLISHASRSNSRTS